jgi:hypothetical protein
MRILAMRTGRIRLWCEVTDIEGLSLRLGRGDKISGLSSIMGLIREIMSKLPDATLPWEAASFCTLLELPSMEKDMHY